MFRLVEPDAATTRQGNCGHDPPTCFLNLGAGYVFALQHRNEGSQIIAHQIQYRSEHSISGAELGGTSIGWMDCCFSRGHSENQPAVAGIDGRKSKNIAKKCPVRFRISTMQQKMRTDNHSAEYIRTAELRLTNLAAPLKIGGDVEPWLANRIYAAKMPVPYRHEGSFRTSFRLQASGGVAQVVRATVS